MGILPHGIQNKSMNKHDHDEPGDQECTKCNHRPRKQRYRACVIREQPQAKILASQTNVKLGLQNIIFQPMSVVLRHMQTCN